MCLPSAQAHNRELALRHLRARGVVGNLSSKDKTRLKNNCTCFSFFTISPLEPVLTGSDSCVMLQNNTQCPTTEGKRGGGGG